MADESTTAQVHPEKLTHALLDEAKSAGAQLRIGTVQGINVDSEGLVTGALVLLLISSKCGVAIVFEMQGLLL